jgi:glycosyltransferase involved in cell wall biosynthesis
MVSIITPSYNQSHFIEQAIQSVLSQDYPHIEYIVMDGGSTDSTLDILTRYQDRLTWFSEPDRGQADAINKGFSRAQGTILGWLNSDDIYIPGAIRTVVNYLRTNPDSSFVFGNVLTIDEYGKPYGLRTNVRPTTFDSLIHEDDSIVQPGAFWRAEVWQRCGPLNVSLHYTLDYDYWIRVAQRYPLSFIPACLACDRLYANTKTASGGIERLVEVEQVVRQYGGNGLPKKFRAEATASYFFRAFNHLCHLRAKEASSDFGHGVSYIQWSPRFWGRLALFMITMGLWGTGGAPHLRRLASRLKGRSVRSVET